MVIATSDSSNTLVSLDDVRKFGFDHDSHQKTTIPFERTAICLPEDSFDIDESDYWYSPSTPEQQYLYLPATEDASVDECLRAIPQVMESADELLAESPRHFTIASPERLLYVGQGEVAHATATQCDVVASDKSTTCHILAFRSVCPRQGPLVSLTHIDAVGYDQCIRNMVQEHKRFHQAEEQKCDDLDRINVDIYIMGGFDDDDQASQHISSFILKLLSQIANDNLESLTLTLKTCAISSMNDSGDSAPIGRGLGIDIETGAAFLCRVDESVAGPVPTLRSARLWSGNGGKSLSLIHSINSKNVHIPPFSYSPVAHTKVLLSLSDLVLLQYTSTSPDVEQDDFCDSVRSTLMFMETSIPETFFGSACDRPAIYSRVGTTNQWKTTR